MRVLFFAAVSCMLASSINGMEKKTKELPTALVSVAGIVSGAHAGHSMVEALHGHYHVDSIGFGFGVPLIAVLCHKQISVNKKIAAAAGWGVGALMGVAIASQRRG